MGRLHVIPARDAAVAVIIRRGPSDWYHLILWETDRAVFSHGAWIKARIYEEKCDISPDGRLFIYFVHQGSRGGTTLTDSWTAISRPPWLHALGLWPHGTTYGGGGRFCGPRTVWGVTADGAHPDFPFPPRRLQITSTPPEARPTSPAVEDADWTGHDLHGQVIFSRGDLLFRRTHRGDVLVANFSELQPDPQPAPAWAQQPL